MKKYTFLLLALLMGWGLLTAFTTDENPFTALLRKLEEFSKKYPTEKVHLHLDKPYYAIGEDVWIKAYVVTAEKNEPSELSKVLYIDLLDDNSKVKKKAKIEITNGLADGHISLIDSIAPGTYSIRAYTNYMRNYNAAFFFEKKITIGSVENPYEAEKKRQVQSIDFQFFPEGGDLIQGIRSRIGIKAVGSDGLGINLSGYIENDKKEKVAQFSTAFAGMGVFALRPEKGETYKAYVTLSDGKTRTYPLPNILENGFALAVQNNADSLIIRVGLSVDRLSSAKKLFVVIQNNGKVYAHYNFTPSETSLSTSLSTRILPTGITQITLFNELGKPVAERLVFINHHDQLKIAIDTIAQDTRPKKENKVRLKVSDHNLFPVDGSFSVAVIDLNKFSLNEDHQPNLLSNVLLCSDLIGFIERPNYYFEQGKEKLLDNLMLTQGWRRFDWENLINGVEPEITFRPEASLEITGTISNKFGKPKSNATVNLISITPGLLLKLDTLTNDKGYFIFDRLDLPANANFIIRANAKQEDQLIANITPHENAKVRAIVKEDINISAYLENTKKRYEELEKINQLDNGILLKTVTISKQRDMKPPLNIPNSKNASGSANYVVTREMIEKEISIYSPFLKIPGVIIKNGLIYSMRRFSITSNPPMLLIIDGIQIDQRSMPDFLSSVNPKDVEGIEVLTSPTFTSVLGPDATGGAVYITTKTGVPDRKKTPNQIRINNVGFTPKKIFYSPRYDNPETNQNIADYRSTIYWNPNVSTNDKGEGEFSFFNAGTPGNYQMTIEGLDAFGNIGRAVYTYRVK